MTKTPNLFDARLRRTRRRSTRTADPKREEILAEIGERLLERLSEVRRSFSSILVIGALSERLVRGLFESFPECRLTWLGDAQFCDRRVVKARGDASFLPFAEGAFDLVLCVMEHHAVGDLPGSLVQIRRILVPDGLMISVFPGGETLAEMRYALMQAEIATAPGVSARVLPFVDIRDAGALLQRAGLSLPVADIDRINLTYPDPLAVIAELRALGETNCLRDSARRPISRHCLWRFLEICASEFQDGRGRFRTTVDLLFLTGWAPHESQPQALRPGSALQRLADALDAGHPAVNGMEGKGRGCANGEA